MLVGQCQLVCILYHQSRRESGKGRSTRLRQLRVALARRTILAIQEVGDLLLFIVIHLPFEITYYQLKALGVLYGFAHLAHIGEARFHFDPISCLLRVTDL